jgi:hypothetical protein
VTRRKAEREDDRDRLEAFIDRARLVEQSTLVVDAPNSSLNISWTRGAPLTFATRQPNADVLKSLLVDLRPLVQPGDAVNMLDIMSICDRRLSTDRMRQWIRDVRSEWLRSQRQGTFGLRINERDMRPDYVADLVISTRFHSSISRKRELDAIVGEARLLTDHLFIDYVYSAIEAVVATASAVRPGLATHAFDWN